MTQEFGYAGSALTATVRLNGSGVDGVPGVTQNADGTYAVGGVTIDDPTGSQTFIELQEFTYDETDCARERVFTGFLSNMRVNRGPDVDGAGRIYDFDLVDLNYLLHLQPFRGADAKRPLESGDDRLAWLMSSVALDGIVFDNGFVGSNPNMFDEADYTLEYAESVLSDLCVSSVTEVGRIFFVYRDDTSGQPSLFIDVPTVTTYTSTLSISNVLGDLSSTCFEPLRDAELTASGEDIYCSVFFKYKTGTVYAHNDATHATYFAGTGYHRQAVFETTRVGSVDTATRHANAFLANHAGNLDTITCTLPDVPAASVNLLEAGMRVSAKFSHLPGFDSFSYLRVSSRTVVPTTGRRDLYDLHLTLSNKSLTPAGGGGTGGFPNPPSTPPSIVQHKQSSDGQMIPDSPTTAGNLGLFWQTSRVGMPATPTGWTVVDTTDYPSEPTTAAKLCKKILTAGETLFGTGAECAVFIETDAPDIDAHVVTSYTASTNATVVCGGPLASPFMVIGFAIMGHFGGLLIAPNAASTTLEDVFRSTTPDAPRAWVGYIPAGGGTVGGTMTGTPDDLGSAGVTISLVGPAALPPTSGEWVYREVVTMSGASGTTAFPYAPGSLVIRVDGVVISAASYTETDPATGTFTLDWAPDADETVTVDYQGI